MFTPLGERVLVRPIQDDEQQVGGIVIPQQAREAPTTAEVVRIGTGGLDFMGNPIHFDVQEGDTVLLSRFGGMEVEVDGEKLKVVAQSDILGVAESE